MSALFGLAFKNLKYKRIQFITWTIFFTAIFTRYVNAGLSAAANRNSDSLFTYSRTLDYSGMLILAIPAAILSLVVMTAWLKVNGRVVTLPIAEKIGLSWFIQTGGVNDRRIIKFISLVTKGIKALFKKSNKKHTSGRSNSSSRNRNSYGAHMAHTEALNESSKKSDDNRKADGDKRRQEDETRRTQAANQRKQKEDDARARREADDLQKQADFDKKRAVDQLNYNPNTHHASTRVGHAAHSQNKANNAKRNLR